MRLAILILLAVFTASHFAAAQSPTVVTGTGGKDKRTRKIAASIDKALAADWADRKITPATEADDAEFARRVYLDIVGRIPKVSEVREFEDDKTPNKRDLLVDKLLQKPSYAVHMASVLRAAWLPETLTDIFAQYPGMQYEDWLRRQLLVNAPIDKIVRRTLTANIQIGGPRNFRAVDPLGYNADDLALQAFYNAGLMKPENLGSTVTRAFLGIKLECAQCHDHPFAPYTRNQFWEFAAFFGELTPQPRMLASFEGPLLPQYQFNTLTIPDSTKVVSAKFMDGTVPQWTERRTPRVELADWITDEKNPYFARNIANRLWHQFFGIGLIDPVDEPGDANPASHPELLSELAKAIIDAEYDLRIVIRGLAASKAYNLSSKQSHPSQSDPRRFARMNLKGLTGHQIYDSFATATGIKQGLPRNQDYYDQGLQMGRFGFRTLFPSTARPTETQTSILQALMMMNSKLIADQTSLDKSEILAAIADAPFLDTDKKVEAIFFAALTRKPTAEEREKFTSYIDRGGPTGDKGKALCDVFWVLLNTTEFLFNH